MLMLMRMSMPVVMRVSLLIVMVMGHGLNPNSFSLSAPGLLVFLIFASAQPSPVLLVPCTEGLAAKHEVVVLDDRRCHPGCAVEVDFAGAGLGDVEVRDDHVWLGGPSAAVVVCCLRRRHAVL